MKEYFYKVRGDIVDGFLNGSINSITLKLYLIMIQRGSITRFIDESNKRYFVLTRKEIKEILKNNCAKNLNDAMKLLEELGVIEIKKLKGHANRYYLKGA